MIVLGAFLASVKIPRCGVILISMRNGIMYFGLAKDKKTRELTDFGGGVKKSEFALAGALRELKEESRELFDINPNDCIDKIALVDNQINYMGILFLPVNETLIDTLPEQFQKQNITNKNNDEISEVVWLDEYAFDNLIRPSPTYFRTNYTLWCKIRKFLSSTYQQDTLRALKIAYQ